MSESEIVAKIKGRLEQAAQLNTNCTREDLATALGVSKVTVAAWVRAARKEGLAIKTARVRQGKRGPKALAYSL
jgi:transposase